MSKSNFVSSLLLGLLVASVLATVGLCYWYVRVLNYAQALQAQGQGFQRQLTIAGRNQEIVRGLVSEALNYSKRNANIDPVLYQLDLKARPGAPTQAKPASR